MARKKKLTGKNQYYSEVQRLVNDSSGLSVLLMKEILERAGYSDRTSPVSGDTHPTDMSEAAAMKGKTTSGGSLPDGCSGNRRNVKNFQPECPGWHDRDISARVSRIFSRMALDRDTTATDPLEGKADSEILDELRDTYADILNCLDRLMAAGAVRDETAEEILEKYGKEAGDTVLKYGKMKK